MTDKNNEWKINLRQINSFLTSLLNAIYNKSVRHNRIVTKELYDAAFSQ